MAIPYPRLVPRFCQKRKENGKDVDATFEDIKIPPAVIPNLVRDDVRWLGVFACLQRS